MADKNKKTDEPNNDDDNVVPINPDRPLSFTERVDQAKGHSNATEDAHVRGVVQELITHYTSRGGFFKEATDGFVYFYDPGPENPMFASIGDVKNPNRKFLSKLTDESNLVDGTNLLRKVVRELDLYARKGDPMKVYRFAHYDEFTQVLYISLHNGTILKLNGEEVNPEKLPIIPNGSKDCLFIEDIGGEEVQIQYGNWGIIKSLIVDTLEYSDEDAIPIEAQKELLFSWILALPFRDFLRSVPILLIDGPKGSGKTTLLKILQEAFIGKATLLTLASDRNMEDFAVRIMRSPIAAIDGVDTKLKSQMIDLITSLTTSGEVVDRQLYTNSEVITLSLKVWMCFCTRAPNVFERDDLLDRVLPIRLSRREGKSGYKNESEIFDQLYSFIPMLRGELYYWANQIVRLLRAHGGKLDASPKFRLSDFVGLQKLSAEARGLDKSIVDEVWNTVINSRANIATDDDYLLHLLCTWAQQPGNKGKKITSVDLYPDLCRIAEGGSLGYSYTTKQFVDQYPNTRALGAAIARNKDFYSKYLKITQASKIQNKTRWEFEYIGPHDDTGSQGSVTKRDYPILHVKNTK